MTVYYFNIIDNMVKKTCTLSNMRK